LLAVVGLLLAALTHAPNAALAQPPGVRGEANLITTGGYGRLVIRTAADVESQVRMTSGILVIQFRQPVSIAVERLGTGANEYIAAARRDPDGRPRTMEEQGQDLQRLSLDWNRRTAAAQFERLGMELERSEANRPTHVRSVVHVITCAS